MSLQQLKEQEVFSHHTLDIADTRHLYQPYSQIAERPSDRVEERAQDCLRKGKALIVKDDRGTGKSSLVNYVLLELGDQFFPISFRLGYAGDFEKVCSDPDEFTRYVLTRTLAEVQKVSRISKADRLRYRRYVAQEISFTEGRRDKVLVKLKSAFSWIPALASTEWELGGDLERHIQEVLKEKVYSSDRIEAIRELCKVITAREREPVLVFDDTDHFLQQGAIDRRHLVDSFFVDIVPMFSEFGCGVILSAHRVYDNHETFRSAQKKHFAAVLKIPLVGMEGFVKIVEKKLRAIYPEAEVSEFFERDALEAIYEQAYRKKAEERMRDTMLVLQESILAALQAGLPRVTFPCAAHALFDVGR